MAVDAEERMRAWIAALEEKDVDGVLDGLADDVEMRVEALDAPMRGKEMWRGTLERAFGAISRLEIELRKVIAQGNEVALLGRARGRFQTDYDVAGVTIAARGKSMDLDFALFATLDDEGKITRYTRVRDNLEVLRQFGMSLEEYERVLAAFDAKAAPAR